MSLRIGFEFEGGIADAMARMTEDLATERDAARTLRHDERQERLAKMNAAAAKLDEVADDTIGSAVLQGVVGLAAAAASVYGEACVRFSPNGEELRGVENAFARYRGAYAPAGQTLQALDPLRWEQAADQADKAKLDVQAEAARGREEDAAERASALERHRDSATGELRRALDTIDRSASTALRA